MYQEISVWLIVYTVLAVPLLVVAHVIQCRVQRARSGSPQTKLVRLILWSDVFFLIGICVLALGEGRSFGELVPMALFFLIVYNSAAFAYFQVLNMSETARRIRMLVEIWHSCGEMAQGKLIGVYTPETMVRARLDRLISWGQISKDANGLYRVKGKFLLASAYLVEWIKRILNVHHRRIHDPNR